MSKFTTSQIVQEFYAQIPRFYRDDPYPDSLNVCLQGKKLNFSINRIAYLLKLSRPDAPGFPALRCASDRFAHGKLTKLYRTLNTIVSADIDPDDDLHDFRSLNLDRASLLYAIGNNVPIDLPAYIFGAIFRATNQHSETYSFPFGSLITRFAMGL
ncbi:uncharacterized protein Pyn_06665 [Prunus yedoensis var. nudiflora]|uniref:Putative plant transposon protein domain-containing protein n=1 Tax=Prunus yedoensis var. nudiflora TaxID=2094558 RepID=A0A314UIF3_PRUYE|nr:uncharacterized protein Pyn_06665 [Prunus yedoensis var. nudiflora]